MSTDSPAAIYTRLADRLEAEAAAYRQLAREAAEREASGESDPFLTVTEAAAQLACSGAFVRSLCARGRIKALRTDGGKYRIRMSALKAYERKRTTSTRTEV